MRIHEPVFDAVLSFMKSNTKPAANPCLNRRAFLQRTTVAVGATLAAPLIVPARALGAEGQVAPSNRINIGMIGTGRQVFYANLPWFLWSKEAQVVAVCDVDSWRMQKAKAQVEETYAAQTTGGTYKGCATCRDFRELLARKDIDAVMISAPDHWHAYMAVEAAKAGKDIALEKPISLSVAEGRAISDAVRNHGRIFRTDTEVRSERFSAVVPGRAQRASWPGQARAGRCAQGPAAPGPESPVHARAAGVGLSHVARVRAGPALHRAARAFPASGTGLLRQGTGLDAHPRLQPGRDAELGNAHPRHRAVGAEHRAHGAGRGRGPGEFPHDNLWDVLQRFEVRYRYASGIEVTYTNAGRPFVRVEGTDGWIENTWFQPDGFIASDEDLLQMAARTQRHEVPAPARSRTS